MSATCTVDQQKRAVILLVGSVNDQVKKLIEDNIDKIWCAALAYNCVYPLTVLYAQREAIDFALAMLVPFVNQKRGKTDGYRTAKGYTRHEAESKTTGRGQGYSCDWSNTASFAVGQTNGDSWSRARSASDHGSQTFFYSHSWDRGRIRDDASSASAYSRRSETARTNESEDFNESSSRTASRGTAGLQVPSPAFTSGVVGQSMTATLQIPTAPINIPTPFGPIVIDTGTFLNYSASTPATPDPTAGAACGTIGVPCPGTLGGGLPPIPTDVDADNLNFPLHPVCNLINYSASSEANVQLTIGIPFLAALTISGSWAAGVENRPRCMSGRTDAASTSYMRARTWMRGKIRGGGSSRSDSAGTRQNDAHTRASGAGSSSQFDRSVGDSYSITISESHSGSDTNSHGESQTTNLTNSRAQSQGTGWHRTESDRKHEFDIRMYSDAFDALNKLRVKIEEQIIESLAAMSQIYGRKKVRDTSVKCDIRPRQLARGRTSCNYVCGCDSRVTIGDQRCFVSI